MSIFATLFSLEQEYNAKMFLRENQFEQLAKYFPPQHFPRIELEYPDWRQKKWTTSYPYAQFLTL